MNGNKPTTKDTWLSDLHESWIWNLSVEDWIDYWIEDWLPEKDAEMSQAEILTEEFHAGLRAIADKNKSPTSQ